MHKPERTQLLKLLEQIFRNKTCDPHAIDDEGAMCIAFTAMEVATFSSHQKVGHYLSPSEYAERARLARLWHRAIHEARRWNKVPRTQALLCAAIAVGLGKTEDAEEAKTFASELTQVAQVYEESLKQLEAKLKEPILYMPPARAKMILEAAACRDREVGWTYPIYNLAAHRFAGTLEFLDLFRTAS